MAFVGNVSPTLPPTNPFGSDFWIGGNPAGLLDGDSSLRQTTGRALLAQRLLMRQSTPQGSVIDCPNDCIDIRDELSDGMTLSQISSLASVLRLECLKDQQVNDMSITGTYNFSKATLQLTEFVTSFYGPFTMVIQINAVTVILLNANLGPVA